MKLKFLSFLVFSSLVLFSRSQQIITYAITGEEKGGASWSNVKLIDAATGEVLQTIYTGTNNFEILNARTGKAVVKKELEERPVELMKLRGDQLLARKVYLSSVTDSVRVRINGDNLQEKKIHIQRMMQFREKVYGDKPFSTNSAACAYDAKHDRLYYTPMGINQLRYIDLKSKTPVIYYFEDESFGVVAGRHDVANQITRMTFGADGNGYALSNNGDHLIRFSTKKKAVITDLGALSDDPSNGDFSIHSSNGFGGDMVAGDKGNFYVITAGRVVFKIDPEKMIATYKGAITGLPRGFSTNGAAVEKGTSIIVTSSSSTLGYFRFDLNTMAAEKLPNSGSVFNASDLANGNLIAEKKTTNEVVDNAPDVLASRIAQPDPIQNSGIVVYPNPATPGSTISLSFKDQPKGKYSIQLLEISGKVLQSKDLNIGVKNQLETLQLPELTGKGNFLVKVVNDAGKVISINKILVQ